MGPRSRTRNIRGLVAFALFCLGYLGPGQAQEPPQAEPRPGHVMLPQRHEYQRVLRAYLATLSEGDFAHGVPGPLTVEPCSQDPDYLYRNFMLTQMLQPLVGSKRAAPSVNAPARLFLLSQIEGPEAVMVPPVWPETLISFVQWDYPGNPYHDNRALKLRAFVVAAVNLMMLDDYLQQHPTSGRSDWYSYQLVYLGAPYLGFAEVLPAEVRQAYRSGLARLARLMLSWGIKGEEPNLDMIQAVGLWYAIQVVDDPAFTPEAEARVRMLFTDPRYFHPAGYFPERGGIDVGFGGMTNFFAAWAALASGWDFAREAVARAYRLRSLLCLPEPDGTWTGPSAFNSRLGTDACHDQWAWGKARDYGASLVTDEAAYLVSLPTAAELREAPARRAAAFNEQLRENPVKARGPEGYIFYANEEIVSRPWEWRMWASWDFPASVNWAYEFYPRGAYAHRLQLEEQRSPLLKSPYHREGTFVLDLGQAFFVTKQPGYATIIHTGPVGQQEPGEELFQFAGPLGLGGGQLSAFWTPHTGSVILGRRRGMDWDGSRDRLEQWRLWPIHAVSGRLKDDTVFTSARLDHPAVATEITGDSGTATVSGRLPGIVVAKAQGEGAEAKDRMYDQALRVALDYTRTFEVSPSKLRVTTTVSGQTGDIAELYETLPIYHREASLQPNLSPTVIELRVGDAWVPASDDYQPATAVRLTRFAGAVAITFDRARRVKLSPGEWQDDYLSRAVCRNLLIDLLEEGPLSGGRTITYEIAPAGPAPPAAAGGG